MEGEFTEFVVQIPVVLLLWMRILFFSITCKNFGNIIQRTC